MFNVQISIHFSYRYLDYVYIIIQLTVIVHYTCLDTVSVGMDAIFDRIEMKTCMTEVQNLRQRHLLSTVTDPAILKRGARPQPTPPPPPFIRPLDLILLVKHKVKAKCSCLV